MPVVEAEVEVTAGCSNIEAVSLVMPTKMCPTPRKRLGVESGQDTSTVINNIKVEDECLRDEAAILKDQILKELVNKEELSPMPFSFILAISTMIAARMENIIRTKSQRMTSETKKEVLLLSQNQ